MAKKKSKSKRLDLTKPVELPRMPFAVMVRMFLIGSIGVVAAGYAIYRHYYIARPSMLMSVPAEPAASEIPVPDFVPVPATDPTPSR